MPLPEPLRHRAGRRAGVRVGGHTIGTGAFTVIAGPCAVESEDQLLTTAMGVADAGAHVLRGGAFKPRTSPHSFQGMGRAGLDLLAAARAATGIPVVTELVDVRDVDRVCEVADMLQIGARSMQNVPLLREAARSGRPVLLKRNPGATVAELLSAADYLLAEGNEQVVLCERGIRTFEGSTRYTLDISAVPVIRERTHLPVIVDPSHAAGRAALVGTLAQAAVAAGADGIMVEVHVAPADALSDGPQSILLDDFPDFLAALSPFIAAAGRHHASPPHVLA